MVKGLVVVGYFMGLGYAIAKTGADKKIAQAVKRGYTELVRYTSEVAAPVQVHIELVNTGLPAEISGGENGSPNGSG